MSMEGEHIDSNMADSNPTAAFVKLQPRPAPLHIRRAGCQKEEEQQQQLMAAVTKPEGGDGATIEVARRPRGRPPGSRNKPKPPLIITRESDPPMSPHILEVPCGADLIASVIRFSCRRNVGICMLAASGTVGNVTLRQPSTTPASTVTFHGRFDILSISGTCFPPGIPPTVTPENRFTISLASPQGQIVGGIVSGALLAAGTVFIIAASLNNPTYHRFPCEEESSEFIPPFMESNSSPKDEAREMVIFGGNLQPSVMWNPRPRQSPTTPSPPPPPPPPAQPPY